MSKLVISEKNEVAQLAFIARRPTQVEALNSQMKIKLHLVSKNNTTTFRKNLCEACKQPG